MVRNFYFVYCSASAAMRNVRNYIILLLVIPFCNLHAQTPVVAHDNDSVFSASALSSINTKLSSSAASRTLYLFVFLSPECPLCQNYTPALNQLQKKYADKLCVYGIIPGRSYDAKTIKTFREKYKIAYPLLTDASFRLSRYLHASITPEVVLLNEKQELVYRGAIDDWLKDLGKMKTKISVHYLEDAIEKYPHQATIKRTKAVGCLINDQ